jgi:hypothetical protein
MMQYLAGVAATTATTATTATSNTINTTNTSGRVGNSPAHRVSLQQLLTSFQSRKLEILSDRSQAVAVLQELSCQYTETDTTQISEHEYKQLSGVTTLTMQALASR